MHAVHCLMSVVQTNSTRSTQLSTSQPEEISCEIVLSPSELLVWSVTVSIYTVGGMVGAFLTGTLVGIFGRSVPRNNGCEAAIVGFVFALLERQVAGVNLSFPIFANINGIGHPDGPTVIPLYISRSYAGIANLCAKGLPPTCVNYDHIKTPGCGFWSGYACIVGCCLVRLRRRMILYRLDRIWYTPTKNQTQFLPVECESW